jgi:molybdopterin-guanine dinucleotide biosynthesis protein A
MSALIGLFVGGKSRRMGGIPKGLLPAPGDGRSVARRLCDLCRTAIPQSELVLVGNAVAYGELGLEAIADDPSGVGPLGGLHALLKQGETKGSAFVFSLACDLPYVSAELLSRLANERLQAIALAPFLDDRWQPFFARYQPAAVRPRLSEMLVDSDHSLQAVFRRLGAGAERFTLSFDEERLLSDWDTPNDMHR